MSTGKLKAQYNRVRTSTALHTSSIWANTIGIESEQAGTNAAIEASIYAPGGGGRGRAHKQQRAQELIEQSGFQPSVRDFEGLKALARRSGGDAAALNRGACKICGGLGHLTKQCRNFLDGGGQGAGGSGAAAGGAAAAGGGDGGDARALLTEADEALLLGSDSMDSSELGSGSDSDASRGRKRSRRDKERSSSKRHKKEKSSKRHKKEKSSRKHSKRSHRSRSRSRSRGRDRRDRSRSRSRSRSRDRAQGL